MNRDAVQNQLVVPNYWGAIVFGIFSYVIVSLRHPLAWSMPFWFVLAFVIVPGIIGLTIGKVSLVRTGASASFFVTAMLMFFYTAFGLMRAHAPIGSSADPGQIFFVGVLVSIVYAIAAGVVSGLVNVAVSGRKAR